MLINGDVACERTVRMRATGRLDLTVRLPRRSYVSLVVDPTPGDGLGGRRLDASGRGRAVRPWARCLRRGHSVEWPPPERE
jgi:hypothetical protein